MLRRALDGRIFTYPVAVHAAWWAVLFFLTVYTSVHNGERPVGESLVKNGAFLLVGALPLYGHAWAHQRLFLQRRYRAYALALAAALVLGWALLHAALTWYHGGIHDRVALFALLALGILTTTGLSYAAGPVQQYRLQEALAKQYKAELEQLRAQIHPHFLFNSLNNIYALLLKSPDEAGRALLQLAGLMRVMLDSSGRHEVRLEEELAFLGDYVALERLRLGDRCDVRMAVSGESGKWVVMPLLFVPFVENAFKHGPRRRGPCFVDVRLDLEPRRLVFTVENAVGPRRPADGRAGTGLANVRRRLELRYPGRHRLRVEPTEDRFLVVLEIEREAEEVA
jgi:hypothetical protein